jgi:D-threo-aldose 1-dehydrogenase
MALPPSLIEKLRATPLALGGAPLGNLFRPVSDAEAREVVQHAWSAGVRYFDTAPHYGNGRSEVRMGTALRDYPRDAYALSTKVGRLLDADRRAARNQHGYVDVPAYAQHYDYTAEGVRRSLADSRMRMAIERIDLALVHDVDVATRGDAHERHLRDMLGSGFPELARLRDRGEIGGYGLGVNGVDICLRTLQDAELDAILLAGRYTLADQTALATLLPECERRNVAVIAAAPFNSGILATGSRPADGSVPYFDYASAPAPVVARVAGIEAVCEEFDVPLMAAALQFPRAHPAVVCVLAGARTAAEIATALRLASLPIPPEFWRALRAQELIAGDAPVPGDRP